MADESWTLCICGDVEKVFAVLVGVSNTVADLKEIIHGKSLIPVDEQSLYFQEQLMRDDRALSSISELSDGEIVYLSRHSLTLNVRSLLSNPPEELHIKLCPDELQPLQSYSVSYLKNIICDRIGSDSQCILMCRGEILNEVTKLSECPAVTDGAKIILQRTPTAVMFTDDTINVKFKLCTPQGTNMSFIRQQLSYKTGVPLSRLKCGAYVLSSEEVHKCTKLQFKTGYLSKDKDEKVYSDICVERRIGWILDVQRLDGTKVSVHVPEKKSMPIVKLKECIEECTGVPTHQQRLTIGDTIVEDWDEEDRMMFIGDYPNIQHGSLLYLIQHDGGYRMTIQCFMYKLCLIKKKSLLNWFESPNELSGEEYRYQTRHFYVNSVKSYEDLMKKALPGNSSFSVQSITDCKGYKVQDKVGADYKIILCLKRGYNTSTINW